MPGETLVCKQAKILKMIRKNNISDHFPQIPATEACLLPHSAGSYAFSILPFVSVRTAHLLLWGKGELLCIFIRSWGLQVAERTRLITWSGPSRVGGRNIFRGGRNRRTSRRIRGKSGVIERRGRVFENRQGGSRVKGRRQVETRESYYLHKCLCCALWSIHWKTGHGQRAVVKGNYLNVG